MLSVLGADRDDGTAPGFCVDLDLHIALAFPENFIIMMNLIL